MNEPKNLFDDTIKHIYYLVALHIHPQNTVCNIDSIQIVVYYTQHI